MADTSETQFPQWLMSDASKDVFPVNKPQHFTVHLPRLLDLPGVWLVGLKDFQYPHNWYTVKNDIVFTVKTPAAQSTTKVDLTGLTVSKGHYKDISDLMMKINDKIESTYRTQIRGNLVPDDTKAITTRSPGDLEFDKYLHHISWTSIVSGTEIDFGSSSENFEILNLLGLYPITKLASGEKGKNEATLKMHFPNLYIYSPIIQHARVGNTLAPLLALVPIRGEQGEYIFERYEKPHYHRIAHNQISDIEIFIAQKSGEEVPFLTGSVTLCLDFRRVS